MSRGRSRWGDFEASIDMTPMIDVVFNLLIFFICTIRVVTLDGQLAAELPRNAGRGPQVRGLDPMKILILYDPATGRAVYRAGRTSTEDRAELIAAIAHFVRVSPGVAVEITPDRGVPYRHVILVLDACAEARAPQIRFSGVPAQTR